MEIQMGCLYKNINYYKCFFNMLYLQALIVIIVTYKKHVPEANSDF